MKAGYKGDGDWMGADRDSSNDDYAPDFLSGSAGGDVELFNALAVLERHLSSGGRKSGAPNKGDDYSPDGVDAALAHLERSVATGRRYGMYGLSRQLSTAPDSDDGAGVLVEPEMTAAVELVKRGLQRKATIKDTPDSDDIDADVAAGLDALVLLKRKAMPPGKPRLLGKGSNVVRQDSIDEIDDDGVECALVAARNGALIPRDSDDELMLAMKDLTTNAHQRKAKRRPGRGSSEALTDRDDDDQVDSSLVEAMSGLLARRRKGRGSASAAKDVDDGEDEPLADAVLNLMAKHRSISKGLVRRDTDDAALIDGVSDVVGKWQAKPPSTEVGLLAMLGEWIDTDEARRRRAKDSGAVRDENDVRVIDSLSGMIADRQSTAGAITRLMAQHRSISKGLVGRDTDDAALIDGVPDVVSKWEAEPKATEVELLAMMAEWIDTDAERRRRAKDSGAVRNDDDVRLIDSLSGMIADRQSTAGAITRLMAQNHAIHKGKVGAERDADDMDLIDGVADKLGKWQASPSTEVELLAMLGEWIDTDEARRRQAQGSGAVRDEDDVRVIDSLSGLIAERQSTAAAVTRLMDQNHAIHQGKIGAERDADDMDLIDGVAAVLGKWKASPSTDVELLAMMAEWIDTGKARRRQVQGSGADRDEDDVRLIDSLSGLIGESQSLAAAVTRLMNQHHAIHQGKVAAKRDTDDAALIDGVSDVVSKWQAKPKATEVELLAMMAEWIDTDEARRRQAKDSGAVRDDDDVRVIGSLSGLVAERQSLAAAVTRLMAQHHAIHKGKVAPKRDADDATVIEGVADIVDEWKAEPKATEVELLAMMAEWIDTDAERRRRAKVSKGLSSRALMAIRDDDDVQLIDSLSDLLHSQKYETLAAAIAKLTAKHRAKLQGKGSPNQVKAGRDTDDAALIDGVSDVVSKWQAKPNATEVELLAMMAEWIDTDEPRRRRTDRTTEPLARARAKGSGAVRDDDDVLLIDSLSGLIAERQSLAAAVGRLTAQHRAKLKGKGPPNKVAAGRDTDDAALIDGVADVLGKWQRSIKAGDKELLAMLGKWIDKDEARRRRAQGSGAVRDGDDVQLIDSLSDLLHSQKYETLAAAIAKLTAQHGAKLKGKGSVAAGRDADDATVIDGVADLLSEWEAKPKATEEELLAMLGEWIDTDEPRRRSADFYKGSGAVRDEDDVLLIDSLAGLIAERRTNTTKRNAAGAKRRGIGSVAVRSDSTDDMGMGGGMGAFGAPKISPRRGKGSVAVRQDSIDENGMGGMGAFGAPKVSPRRGMGSIAVRQDSIDEMADEEESTLGAMAGLLQKRRKARKGRGSVSPRADENDDIIDAMLNLVAQQNKIKATRRGRGSVAVRPDSIASACSSMDSIGEDEEEDFGAAVDIKKRGGRGSDAVKPDSSLDEGSEGGYDQASADLEERALLGAMSLMVDQMWVRSRMSLTPTLTPTLP